MMILTGKTLVSAVAAAVPLRRRVRAAVPLRAAPVLVPAADLHGRLRLRRARPAGGEHPHPLRRHRPPRRLLRPRVDPRVRAVRDRDRRWRASPARRSLPTSARARSARSSTRCRCSASTRSRTSSCRASWRSCSSRVCSTSTRWCSASSAASSRRRQRRAARPVLGDLLQPTRRSRTSGVGAQKHPVRRDHRDRLLLQGHDGDRRRRGRRRAVNQAVVIAFLGVCAFNYVFTQTLLATHPEITVIR